MLLHHKAEDWNLTKCPTSGNVHWNNCTNYKLPESPVWSLSVAYSAKQDMQMWCFELEMNAEMVASIFRTI